MLYVRFVVCLAIGLLGVCLVLKTLMDTLFADWDVYSDLKRVMNRPSSVILGLRLEDREEDRNQILATRLQRVERRGGKPVAP